MGTKTAVKERPILFSGAMVRAILEGRKTQTRRVWKKQPYKCLSVTPNYADTAVGDLFICPDAFPTEAGPVRSVITECTGVGSYHCMGSDVFVAKHGPKAYGTPGDRLYVKEATWQWCRKIPNGKTKTGRQKYSYRLHGTVATGSVIYVADHSQKPERASYAEPNMVWHYKHARFMQKHLSRITLELTAVRVPRVQEISEEDAQSEGAEYLEHCGTYRKGEPIPASYRYGFQHLWDSINADRGFGWDKNPWVWALTFGRLP